MLAFGLCSHGLAERGDGKLRIVFSDQMIPLENLLKEKIEIILKLIQSLEKLGKFTLKCI